jgi:N-acetylmuramoyl-L-alanine amidase
LAGKKQKRRLKKGALIFLVAFLIALIGIFAVVVKVVADKSSAIFNKTSEEISTIVESNNNNNNNNNNKEKDESEIDDSQEDITESKESKTESKNENVNEADTQNKIERAVVVIDAAFGGEYAGSKGYNGLLQKDVNLGVALSVKRVLERYDDIDVYLTRESDTTVSYEKRLQLIKSKGAHVVVSIQQNTEGTGTATGVETYVLSKDSYPDTDRTLGQLIQKSMVMYSAATDRGIMNRNIDILKDSLKEGAYGAVVYTGFITNEEESKKLTNNDYIDKLGEGIAQGILSFIDKKILND